MVVIVDQIPDWLDEVREVYAIDPWEEDEDDYWEDGFPFEHWEADEEEDEEEEDDDWDDEWDDWESDEEEDDEED